MLINPSEKLALWTLSKLLPEGSQVVHVQQQSHGEHDFDVFDKENQKIAIVEVTAAVHQESKRSLMRERKHGPIRCATLQNEWLLMSHNPDPRWIQERGCIHLAILENHGVIEFDHQTQYFQKDAVAQAVAELHGMGIENGGSRFGIPGTISLLTSRGENSDDWVLSHERVTEVLFKALEQPDNIKKLSAEKHSTAVNRHFFVEIDRATHPAAGDSLANVNPPSETPDLDCRATHIWAVMRANDEVIAWCGDLAGWKSWKLVVDNSLDGN